MDQVAAAIDAFEEFTRHRDFKFFKAANARDWKAYLLEEPNEHTGKPLALSAARSRLRAVRDFLLWLSREPGYRRVDARDADYFNLSARDEKVARATQERPVPSLEDVTCALDAMPADTIIEQRDRALVAFTLITGARISALRTLRLKHVDMEKGTVDQDPREVETKGAKHIYTPFFPLVDDAIEIVGDWVRTLRDELCWTDNDPLFPKQKIEVSEAHRFENAGLDRASYATGEPLRRVFRDAFEAVGIHPYHPHTFRHMIATHYAKLGVDTGTAKAISQSLGHEHLGTMMQTYVRLSRAEQSELVKKAGQTQQRHDEEAAVAAFKEAFRAQLGRAIRICSYVSVPRNRRHGLSRLSEWGDIRGNTGPDTGAGALSVLN